MSAKPHLFFRNALEGETRHRQRIRDVRPPQEKILQEEYPLKTELYAQSIARFYEGREYRITNRNPNLRIPANIEYIKIVFHDIFNNSDFENRYRVNFGLSPIKYTEFNTVGIFAIVNNDRFNSFIQQLQNFIETRDHNFSTYNPDIKFIKEFAFFSTDEIIKYDDFKQHIVINLVDNVELYQNTILPIEERLIQYLNEIGATFFTQDYKVEIFNLPEPQLREIADNFDIIQSINAYEAGIVKPSRFNLPVRSFGFDINNIEEELPIIGIIDTGVSAETPIHELIINEDERFNLTGSSIHVDNANHGTAVAAFASLGTKLIPEHIGSHKADAKILVIKSMNASEGNVPESEVIRLIRDAHRQYGVKIFTLTIGYKRHKKYNEEVSEYAFALDSLAYELNVLIFISAGNMFDLSYYDGKRVRIIDYPYHFEEERTNITPPAESMNNITIGAAASNFEGNEEFRLSPLGSVPASYTRVFHINWRHESMLNSDGKIKHTRTNKHLFKPDITYNGGDFDTGISPERTGLKAISAETGIYFDRSVGTSYSTPLVANIAAKLIKFYPELADNMQTVKALIINAGIRNELGNSLDEINSIESVFGHGIPNEDKILFSDDNNVTMILENSILPNQIKSYPIHIPRYLLERERKYPLKVTATLCFKFPPIRDNQIAYCPIHLAFGFFRNLPLEIYERDATNHEISAGINNNNTEAIKFNKSWSQDYYFGMKFLSNVQKTEFTISKDNLIKENFTFKVCLNSKLHKLLNSTQTEEISSKPIEFSLVFRIEEYPIRNENSNQLYNELIAVNTLELIGELEAGLEIG